MTSRRRLVRPGRPRSDEPQGEQLRDTIVEAASRVYGRLGYRGASVDLIAKEAEVSRALFYRLFSDRRAVIDVLLLKAHDALRAGILSAIKPQLNRLSLASAVVDVYFDWCSTQGPVAAATYREFQDPESPAGAHRERIVAELALLVHGVTAQRGEPPLNPLLVDTLIRAVEHAGSTAFCPSRKSDAEIEMHRAVAKRIVLAAVAQADEIAQVPPLDAVRIA